MFIVNHCKPTPNLIVVYPKYAKVFKIKIDKMVDANIIPSEEHSEWLFPLMVIRPKKKTNKIWVSVDSCALNNTNVKDGFSLASWTTLSKNVVGHALYSFMDRSCNYYNQIDNHPLDQEKQAFVIPWGT